MKPQLNFMYLHSERIGYGAMGVHLAQALGDLGVDVYDGLPGNGDVEIESKRAKVCKDIVFATVAAHVNGWYEGQRAHMLTMWETDELPEAMRDNLHNFETIIVPSQENVELFSRYHDNVAYIPLGVDADRWGYRPRRTNDIFFTFLVAGAGQRKGLDLVHRAYMELFAEGPRNGGPIPRLIMKNPKGEAYSGPNIEVASGYMSPEDEVELYASAHCYVQPSRGEGWGMQPLQAMAQGCPTILTNAHGHAPFATYGLPIRATKTPASYMAMFGDAGQWWEPNYEDLVELMAYVYDDYAEANSRSKMTSLAVRKTFTWEKSAQALIDVLGHEHLRERFRYPYVPKTFVVPDIKLYKVITMRDWKADIAGLTHILKKGVEYWKSADVKRILFEAKVLDPSCVKGTDTGLTSQQLEHLGVYVAEQSKCPTCGHELNDWLDTNDDEVM